MTTGYIDPVTGEYVKSAGGVSITSLPEATDTQKGAMTPSQVKKLEKSYTEEDIAPDDAIASIFN